MTGGAAMAPVAEGSESNRTVTDVACCPDNSSPSVCAAFIVRKLDVEVEFGSVLS